MARKPGPPRAPSPEEATLAKLAELARTGAKPPKMRSAVISLAMGLRISHGSEDAQRILAAVHGELSEGVSAAEEAISGIDKDDDLATAHSRTSLEVLVAARDALAREAGATA